MRRLTNPDGTRVTCEMTGQFALSVDPIGADVAISVDSDGPILMSADNAEGAFVGLCLLPDEAEAIAHALIVAAAKSRQNAPINREDGGQVDGRVFDDDDPDGPEGIWAMTADELEAVD